MEDCGICLDAFNKKQRKRIQCAYCAGAYCKACIQIYLLDDTATEPRCPNPECRLGWSDDFLSEIMTKTWLLNEYKKHREKILVDLERVRLPETQEDAGRYIKAKAFNDTISKQIQEHQTQLNSLPELVRLNQAYKKYYSSNRNQADFQTILEEQKAAGEAYKQASRPHVLAIRKLTTPEYLTNKRIVDAFGVQIVRNTGVRTEQARSAWTFVMKCPVQACEGFVGMNWKCGLCEVEVCKDCREVKNETEEHVCDPEKILTAQAIQKEAKPCPKCAAQISKIDGCDQMWCTQCQTAFSWRTGEIEQSRVHNPHYYEWMRRNGGGPAPPAPENVDCLPAHEIIDHVIHYNRTHRDLMNWCRNIRHFQFILRSEQRHLGRTEVNDKKKHDLRVQRLAGEITDEKWKIALQRIEKAQKKTRRVVEVLELYCQAGVDILRSSLLETANKDAVCNQLQQLKEYCSLEFEKIRSRFNNQVPDLHLIGI